jgi:thiamine kinase-like enzyme
MEEFKILSEIINEIYEIDAEKLVSKCRKRELVELRYVCANILRAETSYTVEKIGEILNIDHSTVCYADTQHENFMINKSARTYADTFEKISKAYSRKIQTPERIESQLEKLKSERAEIDKQIEHLNHIMLTRMSELAPA